jgi:hypothetical protein
VFRSAEDEAWRAGDSGHDPISVEPAMGTRSCVTKAE